MINLNAIFLSKTSSEDIYKMTLNCIDSLMLSEQYNHKVNIKYILIESNKNYAKQGFNYPDFVKVIIPEVEFNFHKFLNIGIKQSSADYYALCNNDILFSKEWFSEIIKVADNNNKILSFSPIDYKSTKLNLVGSSKEYLLGYESSKHISGWCIVIKHELLNIIGILDERFNFYYADDDYGLTLRHYNQYHALVLHSKAKHLGGVTTETNKIKAPESIDFPLKNIVPFNIPWYLNFKRYNWITRNATMLNGHMKFYHKWGDYEFLRIKKLIHNVVMRLGGSKTLSKILFSCD